MPTRPLTTLLRRLALGSLWLSAPLWAAAPVSPSSAPTPLRTVAVQTAGANSTQSSSWNAVVEAVRQTTLSAQVAGAIVSLHVKAGDRVQAGQELLRIDARAAQQNAASSYAQVQAAQSSLNVARQDFARQQQLFQKQFISQAALDRAQAQWLATQAQVTALQAQAGAARTEAGFFVMNAPYAGVVSEVPVAIGDMAMPGRPLLTVYDPSELRVTAAVPQSVMAGLQDTRNFQVELPGLVPGLLRPTRGQVLPMVDAATHTVPVRLHLPTPLPGVSPGVFARVWLSQTAAQTTQQTAGQAAAPSRLYVPTRSVVRRGDMTGVYVVTAEGRALLRQVRLAAPQGEQVEILSGVRQGEQVAIDPQAAARQP